VVALAVGLAVKYTVGFRADTEAEVEGIDIAEHKESAYDLSPTGGGAGAFAMAGITSGGVAPAETLGPEPARHRTKTSPADERVAR